MLNNTFLINKIVKKLISIVLFPLKHLFPKKYIIFSGTTNYNYNGNSRYLFEYLSKESTYEVYWFTRSEIIKKYLIKKNLNCLSYSNPIKLIIISLMAKIVINDGDDYFNIFRLSDTKNTYKISLFHGYGPKTTLAVSENPETKNIRLHRINKFDYVNFNSDYLANKILKYFHTLPFL